MIRSQRWKSHLFLLLTLALLMTVSRGVAARPQTTPGQRVRLTAPLTLQETTYLVWAETSPQSTESTLWLAPAVDLTAAQQLAQVSHRVGYPPRGSVSPDGQWIAIFIIPPGVDERAARLDGGEVWLAASDGSRLDRLASRVGALGQWTPDSRAVAWSRLVELQAPREQQIPFRTEIYRSALDGSAPVLIDANESAYGVIPLGWAADGAQYLSALVGMDGAWTVQAVDATTGQPGESWALPVFEQLREISLAPAGDRLLLETVSGGEDQISILPLGSTELQAQALLASQSIDETTIISPVSALWSASGHIWLATQRQPGETSAQVLAAPGSDAAAAIQSPVAALNGSNGLLPESWSPDEHWFVWVSYPRPHSDVYIQDAQQTGLRKVPSSSPENWISVFGWLGGGAP